MFYRTALKQCAIATLLAVLFVVLLPVAVNASGKFSVAAVINGLAEICSLEGIKHAPQAPVLPEVAAHKPCVFCTSSVPVFADAYAPRLLAVVDGIPVTVGRLPPQDSPPDPSATRPLSARAPPRAL